MSKFKIGDVVTVKDGNLGIQFPPAFYKSIFQVVSLDARTTCGYAIYVVTIQAPVEVGSLWRFDSHELELAPELYQVIYGDRHE